MVELRPLTAGVLNSAHYSVTHTSKCLCSKVHTFVITDNSGIRRLKMDLLSLLCSSSQMGEGKVRRSGGGYR